MRLIIMLACLMSALFAGLHDRFESKILSFDKGNQTITFEAKDLLVGESGWVVSSFSDYSGILAQAEVIECCEDGKAIANIKEFDTLRQVYLPNPTNDPKEGDIVVFRGVNHKAFLVAPNLELYDKIKEDYKEVNFVSSDLLLGYLFSYGGYDPTRLFFREACSAYGVGLVYIINENALDVLDCQSFKILDSKEMDTSEVEDISVPFYSRIEEVNTGTLFSFLQPKKAKFYFAYYTNLLHPEVPYPPLMEREKALMERKKQEELARIQEQKAQEEKAKEEQAKEAEQKEGQAGDKQKSKKQESQKQESEKRTKEEAKEKSQSQDSAKSATKAAAKNTSKSAPKDASQSKKQAQKPKKSSKTKDKSAEKAPQKAKTKDKTKSKPKTSDAKENPAS